MATEFTFNLGQKYPYDGDDLTGEARKPKDWAVKAARGIIADLTDRRDIKRGFEQVDHDVRKEIVDTLAEIIRFAHSAPSPKNKPTQVATEAGKT